MWFLPDCGEVCRRVKLKCYGSTFKGGNAQKQTGSRVSSVNPGVYQLHLTEPFNLTNVDFSLCRETNDRLRQTLTSEIISSWKTDEQNQRGGINVSETLWWFLKEKFVASASTLHSIKVKSLDQNEDEQESQRNHKVLKPSGVLTFTYHK